VKYAIPQTQVVRYSCSAAIVGHTFARESGRSIPVTTPHDEGTPEMTILESAPGGPRDVTNDAEPNPDGEVLDPPVAPIAGQLAPTPVLITEQEVLFSTAAALPLQPAKRARRLTQGTRIVAAAIRATFWTSTADPRPARQHYPERNDYLERSRMSREMYRL
jgi:hypothetical protein